MAHSDIVTLILATLAVYRVSVMITQEEGPFGMFTAMRERIDPSIFNRIGSAVDISRTGPLSVIVVGVCNTLSI